MAKTAPQQKLLADHNIQQKKLQKHTRPAHPPHDPHGAARPYADTLWRTPAKLMGNLALTLLDTPLLSMKLAHQ